MLNEAALAILGMLLQHQYQSDKDVPATGFGQQRMKGSNSSANLRTLMEKRLRQVNLVWFSDALQDWLGEFNSVNATHPNLCRAFPLVTHDILTQKLVNPPTLRDIFNALKVGKLTLLWSEI